MRTRTDMLAQNRAIVFQGAASEVLATELAAGSVDMVYLDPPFGTQQIWTGRAGSFSDKFEWDGLATRRMGVLRQARPSWAALLPVLPIAESDRAYLAFMSELLLELHRVLHPAGSLWLHCDDTMGAYIKLALAAIYGPELLLGDVVWRRTSAHSSKNKFGRIHDTIVVVARSRASRWRLWRSPLSYNDPFDGLKISGYSDIALNSASKERIGYPTQKPVELLEFLIEAGSRPGDIVLDPTCGSGTTLVAAQRTGRRPLGIDPSTDACNVTMTRLRELHAAQASGHSQLSLFGDAA